MIIKDKITMEELEQAAKETFGDFVKAVLDVKRRIMAIGGELHADEEALLLEDGSDQNDLWGINIYPQNKKDERIEYDSMINIRPSQANRSRDIEDEQTKVLIEEIVDELVQE